MIPDRSGLLHLRSAGARLVVGLIIVTQIVNVAFSWHEVRNPWMIVVALGVFSGGLLLAARPRADPYPPSWTVTVVVAGLTTTLLVLWNLPDSGWPGYAAWNFGAVAWLFFVLAFRGRIGAAWIGLALMAAATFLWAATVGRGPLDTLGLVDRHAGTLLMATLFRLMLDRAARQIGAFQSESLAQIKAEAASHTEMRERDVQARQLETEARPALEWIAAGRATDEAARAEYRLLEASLRDTLRGRGFMSSRLRAEVRNARRRGAEVVLLDDRTLGLPDGTAGAIDQVLGDQLRTLGSGRLTARLLPAGRDWLATIVREEGGLRSRIDVPSVPPAPERPPPRSGATSTRLSRPGDLAS